MYLHKIKTKVSIKTTLYNKQIASTACKTTKIETKKVQSEKQQIIIIIIIIIIIKYHALLFCIQSSYSPSVFYIKNHVQSPQCF